MVLDGGSYAQALTPRSSRIRAPGASRPRRDAHEQATKATAEATAHAPRDHDRRDRRGVGRQRLERRRRCAPAGRRALVGIPAHQASSPATPGVEKGAGPHRAADDRYIRAMGTARLRQRARDRRAHRRAHVTRVRPIFPRRCTVGAVGHPAPLLRLGQRRRQVWPRDRGGGEARRRTTIPLISPRWAPRNPGLARPIEGA